MSAFNSTPVLSHEQKISFVRDLEKALELKPCDHSYPLVHARRILDQLGLGLDKTNEVLSFFAEHGGYCDCEIIMNVICE